MLSSRNRKLKRFSRFLAFFVIVFSGVYYRLNKIYENFKEHTSSDEFMENSPMVPPFIKEIHKQSKRVNVRKQMMGVHLPPEDEHELRYRAETLMPDIEGAITKECHRKSLIKMKNPYS